MPDGRFAPSPTGHLHVGNLRTALLAWLFARHRGARFIIRIEDLDPVASRAELVSEHLEDLGSLGLVSDDPVEHQSWPSARRRHDEALASLEERGLLYPCYCTRREIAEAAGAAHGPRPEGAYPGTCRDLSSQERRDRARRHQERTGRDPSLRVRAEGASVTIHDRLHGERTGTIDDFVVRRGDGVPAYNLAVVVDDAHQGIGEVVRGDDLLDGTPRQAWLIDRLGLDRPAWSHVPLVLGPDGERLAKRHGSVTLAQLSGRGISPDDTLMLLARSLGLVAEREEVSLWDLVDRFDPQALDLAPWVFRPPG